MSGRKEYPCSECGKTYDYNKNLRKHVSEKHPHKISDIAPKSGQKIFDFKCKSCDKQFNHFRNLKFHERNIHSAENVSEDSFKCSLCEFRPKTKNNFFEHIKLEHSVSVKSQNIEFSSFEEFLKWKQNVEKETLSRYVKECGSKQCADNSTRHYFVCNRSGHYMCKSTGKRHLKTQGSNKINGACPASMRASIRA